MTTMQSQAGMQDAATVDETIWLAQRCRHVTRLSPVVSAHRQRKIKGRKHPVVDFLFEYYHFKPAKLLEWSPGIGIILGGNKALEYLCSNHYIKSALGVSVNPATFPKHRRDGLEWIIKLLKATQYRKPSFGCFGLHEWCMIYEKSDIRHAHLPLRLDHSHIRKVVEQGPVQCSHYDAFRFYSDSARKYNRHSLSRENMPEQEQPGCLHSNMDLYRWAYKFHPWLASKLIADAFLLALEIRETDMRASPYDISGYTDLPAIKIETTAGKEQYVSLQRQYYSRALDLRQRLVKGLTDLQIRTSSNEKT